MSRIILASASKARQDLLRQIGLSFRVVKSGVKENVSSKNGCADLVKANALKKARYAAKKNKTGVVIAADTLVRVGRRIIGKPKNKKEAIEILKFISKKPQWVYTGLAVIDIDSGAVYIDYDKTKIYMRPLTDDYIKKYIAQVRPENLAGSFDVQGLGAVFIDRIEGCFYNVVGLPLAKLAAILKKAGIDIF